MSGNWANWHWRDGRVDPREAVIFDMDGVLSDAAGRQHFLENGFPDWDAFFEACEHDDVLDDVAALLSALDQEPQIILLTARPIRVQPQTLRWLERYGLRWDLLVMRDFGDYMASSLFKERTVAELREFGFEPKLCFEDDPRNVLMFRRVGVPCVYIHSGYYD